jgi:hypothetical protein
MGGQGHQLQCTASVSVAACCVRKEWGVACDASFAAVVWNNMRLQLHQPCLCALLPDAVARPVLITCGATCCSSWQLTNA